ncbi:hypothetical protein NC651_036557 [Populus alba x Populus x berolinensis]|nr:hypothetical protein NC651_036557 [Populus alba x Populus x berolinensis]
MDMKAKGTLPLGCKISSSKSQNKTQDSKSTEKTCRTFDCCFKRILKVGIYGNAGGSAAVAASFTMKKTPAERSYVSALCRILVILHFRVSE